MTNQPIVVEQTFQVPVAALWQAITDAKQMKHWYFKLEEFRPEPGFLFSFTGGTETKQYIHLCEITEASKEKVLRHTWRYEGYEGNTEVSWELFDEGAQSRLRLVHTGLETLPQNISDFAKENFEQGWQHIIGTALPQYLQSQGAKSVKNEP